MEEDHNKHKTISDDEGHEFTFDNTAEAQEDDIEVIDVTAPDNTNDAPSEDTEDTGQHTGTVTDEERQASFEMD